MGDNIYRWLRISSHEVRHIPQYFEAGGTVQYLWEFVKQYADTQGHDDAPWEIDAEIGTTNFDNFYNWIVANKGANALENLFINGINVKNTIEDWWEEYQ